MAKKPKSPLDFYIEYALTKGYCLCREAFTDNATDAEKAVVKKLFG